MTFFAKKNLTHAIYLAGLISVTVGVTGGITGCQSTPANKNAIPTNTLQNPTLTPSQNAHRLMTQMMIHRFDKAYDFEKTTQYHAYPLYADNDIEKNDQSLWLSLLKAYTDKKSKKSHDDSHEQRELTPAEQECEDAFTQATDNHINAYVTGKINETQYIKKITQTNLQHDKCLDDLPADSTDEPEADTKDPLEVATDTAKTEANIPASKYQAMVELLIAKLNKIDNEADTKPQSHSVKTSSSKTDSKEDSDIDSETDEADKDIIKLLKGLKLTPQQIQVLNDSYLAPHLIRYKGSYSPNTNQYSTVYEESLHRPFVDTYRRVPVLVDFNEMSLTTEPDIVLPLVGLFALSSDEPNSTLQKRLGELQGNSIKFTLPKKLQQKIPLTLLKSTLISAIGKSYGDLPAERFSDVTLDEYAKTIHASRAVKLNLTHQDIGYLFGRAMKYWAIELNTLTAKHPEYLDNQADFKASLELLNALNRHYRADDLAKIAQIIEAILPLSYNGYNYYYFDSQNNLIGYRKNTDYSSSLFGARMTSTTTSQLNYQRSNSTQNNHRYYQPKPAEIIDGNAMLKEIRDENKLKREVQSARWGYTTEAAVRDAKRAATLSTHEKLKFKGIKDCQNFYNKNQTLLVSALEYRLDEDFSTQYPVLQKFFDTCPAQVEKLNAFTLTTSVTPEGSIDKNDDNSAKDAALAAELAADTVKNANDTPTKFKK